MRLTPSALAAASLSGKTSPLVDSYGQQVTGPRPRLRGCRCTVPCLGFRCRSRHHKGVRKSPWCVGGSDSESCADCWSVVSAAEAKRERKRKGRRGLR